ncbi:MAG: L,D-transpeptidase family protein [Ilumatobacteraceae bacterium]
MNAYELRARRPAPNVPKVREARLTLVVVAATLAALGGLALVAAVRDPGGGSVASSAPGSTDSPAAVVPTTTVAGPVALAAPSVGLSTDGDMVEALAADCVIEATKLAMSDTGTDVRCLQQGLINAGYADLTVTGTFDSPTYLAVEKLQTERKLFVDGVVGRETAMSIGVWPDEESFVIRTPAPPAGAQDSWGYPLSSVSSVGADAPPVPANSGSGKRVVYERRGQRVWAIDDDEQVVRSWLVSGSKYGNEQPGFHEVYSRSEQSTAWNGQAILPRMIRYQQTDIGAIGFHGIPVHVSDGTDYQTEAELGTRLSGGCQRQANPDAAFMWAFATVGTTVVVI